MFAGDKELLRFDGETGFFYRAANGARADRSAVNGYRRVTVNGKTHYAHRLAWFYSTGSWPTETIDHINGNRADNRLANLRPATRLEQQGNRKSQKGGTGYRGVHTNRQRFVAHICHAGKTTYIGSFSSAEEAAAAYDREAVIKFGAFAVTNFQKENIHG